MGHNSDHQIIRIFFSHNGTYQIGRVHWFIETRS